MAKGGYIIIDFKGIDLAGDNVKIDGIFRAVTNAYKKAVQITGIVIDGVEYPDAFVAIKSSVLEVYGYKIKVEADDTVKVTSTAGDVEVDPTEYSRYHFRLSKRNDVVYINSGFNIAKEVPIDEVILTLPEGYRPSEEKEFLAHASAGSTYITILIKANGDVVSNHAVLQEDTWWHLEAIYPL